MDSTYIIGLLLVSLSAIFLASHFQQWRNSSGSTRGDSRRQAYLTRTLHRRTVASSLVGIIGVALMAFETVPETPISITAYLLALVLMTCWVLWLALLDMAASRRFHHDQQLDRIARELRRAEVDTASSDSAGS